MTDDAETLRRLGYAQELRRDMGGFSNFALSFSIICILAGGVTSFHLGVCGVGGASVGLGWPLVSAFALAVAATMAQVASAFPTAGGLYHWASLLGGRGWGWATAWLNLAGLVTVIAAVNVGTWTFLVGSIGPLAGAGPGLVSALEAPAAQAVAVALITFSQAALNHLGIRLTSRLTDASGYLILGVTALLVVAMASWAPRLDFGRLWTFSNYSGDAGGGVWPATSDLARLFALGLLLPAYTLTGFDASAHAAEETLNAPRAVPLGIVRSVLVAGLAGWVLLAVVVAAVPDLGRVAAQGPRAFPFALSVVLPGPVAGTLGAGIALAMYGCGLGAVTSASRMAFAFARDGGLPFSASLRRVSPRFQTPSRSVWLVAAGAWLFTIWAPFYATITAVCTIFLYLSYVLPTALGGYAYGRTWTRTGPWNLGRAYRPLAGVCVVGCLGLIAVAMQPPNEQAAVALGAALVTLGLFWLLSERTRFAGPPLALTLAASQPDGSEPVCPDPQV